MEILPLIIVVIMGLLLKKKTRQTIMEEKGITNVNLLKNSRKNPGGLIKNIFDELAKEINRQKELNKPNFKKTHEETPYPDKIEKLKISLNPQRREVASKTEKQTSYDKRIIFILPLFLVLLSLMVSKVKIGGTIMSNLHGWPYPFLTHQIKDILDGFPIDKWLVTLGSAYHYVIFNYLFFLVVVFIIYSFVRANNKK